jgi:hypothetical protein
MNIIEGIQHQCERARELVRQYESIGPVGVFGKTVIQLAIREGEAAIASGDTVRMARAFKSLEECQ